MLIEPQDIALHIPILTEEFHKKKYKIIRNANFPIKEIIQMLIKIISKRIKFKLK